MIKRICAACVLASASLAVYAGNWTVENSFIAWHGTVRADTLQPVRVDDEINGRFLNLNGACFQVELGDGTLLKSSDFKLGGAPEIQALAGETNATIAARHFPGRQLVAHFLSPDRNVSAEWRVVLRDGSAYVREELDLRAQSQDVLVKRIELFGQKVSGANTMGTVAGSPVVAGDFFFGYEQPMAQNVVDTGGVVHCGFLRNAVLKAGESLMQSCVVGVVPEGQLRRGFLNYLERERAHPYRTFLHYNSWYDIAWVTRKYTAMECVDVIDQFGRELAVRRGVKLDSFLFDDGWDDNQTLWRFHGGFPDGLTPVTREAEKFQAGVGVWLSPFGGYAESKAERLKAAAPLGFETNASGFALSGPRYYQRFHDICLGLVEKYGVNQFKFDGMAASGRAAASGMTRDGDAMLNLIGDLRFAEPNIYINQTTGTWPSPFWLCSVDSTWRGGSDHAFAGQGDACQQWMTYRDAQTYANVVQAGPLYPLNSIMLHGIIYATNADRLYAMSERDFADQAREFFGNGTQLQELYLTPALLSRQNWDDLAETAKWSRANAETLVDTHWIGGDPGQGEIYGWASWSPHKGILVLRNPADRPEQFTADVAALFELPPGAGTRFTMRSPWQTDRKRAPIKLAGGQPYTFALQPFEVMVWESQ